jgi:hypothetical protein
LRQLVPPGTTLQHISDIGASVPEVLFSGSRQFAGICMAVGLAILVEFEIARVQLKHWSKRHRTAASVSGHCEPLRVLKLWSGTNVF